VQGLSNWRRPGRENWQDEQGQGKRNIIRSAKGAANDGAQEKPERSKSREQGNGMRLRQRSKQDRREAEINQKSSRPRYGLHAEFILRRNELATNLNRTG
jgi:hypothetical protein